jgi:hypothetical protein
MRFGGQGGICCDTNLEINSFFQEGIVMPSDRQIEASTPYVDKISKMIPAEFVGAYTAIHNIIESNSGLGASDPGYY